ncbi:hypothetical protein PoB_001410500, partial [Plakobranchus ocellatus]
DTKTVVLKTISQAKGTGGGQPIPKSPYHDHVLRILGQSNVMVTGIVLSGSEHSSDSEVILAPQGHFMTLEDSRALDQIAGQ